MHNKTSYMAYRNTPFKYFHSNETWAQNFYGVYWNPTQKKFCEWPKKSFTCFDNNVPYCVRSFPYTTMQYFILLKIAIKIK